MTEQQTGCQYTTYNIHAQVFVLSISRKSFDVDLCILII